MTDTFAFSVKSSSNPDGYTVIVKCGSDHIACSCDCAAGKFAKMCKHKVAVMTGDISVLRDESQAKLLQGLAEELSTSPIGHGMRDLVEAETEVERAKRRVIELRRELEKMIHA
jgi:uncharacterized Zn finger protein